MAVKGNVGQEVILKSAKLYTGVAPFKVIAVNPDQAQLVAMGINAQKEPDYLNGEKVRIDFWLESQFSPKEMEAINLTEQIKSKFSVFMGSDFSTNAAKTKYEWINSFGNTAWSKDGDSEDTVPQMTWFKTTGARKAYTGEGQLLNFIVNWVNSDTRTDEVFLEDWKNIFRGNITEIRELFNIYKDNIIRCMMDIRFGNEGKMFHEIYPYHFARWNQTAFTSWHKHFKGMEERGKVGNIAYSYEVKEYVPTAPTPDAEPTDNAAAASSDWG
jgi:hypothetical protein